MKALLTAAALIACMSTALADTWTYSENVDKMTSKTTTRAILVSENSLSLEFPYAGANYGYLEARRHPQYGLDVIFHIGKGQSICPTYSGCSVKVRFGDKPPVTFQASGPADNNPTVIFLSNAQGFIDQASKVKSIKVQANIYRSGSPILEFESPAPLVWAPKGKVKTK